MHCANHFNHITLVSSDDDALKGSTVVRHWQEEGTESNAFIVVCVRGQVRRTSWLRVANLNELVSSGGIWLSLDVCSLALGHLRQGYSDPECQLE